MRRTRYRPYLHSRPWSYAGLTLVELVVVMAILVILASIAIRSTEGVLDQSRYEATQSGLRTIEEAILGPIGLRQLDNAPLITGFVADVGRLPVLQGADPRTQLQELWIQGALPTFNFCRAPAPDDDIRLACGWKGPYLRLGVGEDELFDGWGFPFALTADGINQIQSIRSRGADNIDGGGTPYDQDITLSLSLVTVSGNIFDGDISTPLTDPGVTIQLFRPDPDGADPTVLAIVDDGEAPDIPQTFVFNNVPIGLRAIRAKLGARVGTVFVYVPRGGLANVALIVPSS